jgi:predicted glycoside hydrolase/deacetylase ChbG (UPF0249 family)
MPDIRLIVNADDFGEDAEVNRGVIDCIDAGVLTSTTIMANMPGTPEALRWAAERGRKASFGVHLNLCEGPALTAATSLTDSSGNFRPKRTQTLSALTGRLVQDEVRAEFDAQIRVVRDAGIKVSHLDSHKHLHQLPGVGAVAAELAETHGIERVRCTRESGLWPRGLSPSRALSRLVRMTLAERLALQLERHRLRAPRSVFDISELMTQADRRARHELLTRQVGISEMFCHPAVTQTGDRRYRLEEYQFLLSNEFKSLVADAGVKLVSYWDV